MVLLALIAATRFMRKPTWQNAVLFGFLIGLSVYVRPILLLFPVAVGGMLLLRRVGVARAARLSAVAMVVALLTLSPWAARNYVAMDAFVLTSTNAGHNFFVANGPYGNGKFAGFYAYCLHCVMDISPSESAANPDPRLDPWYYYSETDQNTLGYRRGIEHIVNHPDHWLSLLPRKIFHLWASDRYLMAHNAFPERYRPLVPLFWILAQSYWMLLVIGAAGAAVSRPLVSYWLRSPAAVLPLALAYWAGVHLFSHGEGRYHMPMIPVVVIVAAHLFEAGRDWRAWLPGRWRRVGAREAREGADV